jgi:hypothetical protein
MGEGRMARRSSSLEEGTTYPVEADNTFAVPYAGATLKFKLVAEAKAVELISIVKFASAAPESSATVLPPSSQIKWRPEDVLRYYNACLLYPLGVKKIADLTDYLQPIKQFSEQVDPTGPIKPRIFIRSDIEAGRGSRTKFNKAVRRTWGRTAVIGTHFVSGVSTKTTKK